MHPHPWPRLTRWLTLAAVVLGSASLAQERSEPQFVLSGAEGFMVLPRELIAAPQVARVVPAPGRQLLLVERESARLTPELVGAALAKQEAGPPPGELSLVLWESRSRSAKEVWKGAFPATAVERIEWLPRTEVALVLVRELPAGGRVRQSLLRIVGRGGRVQSLVVTEPGQNSFMQLSVSPTQPLAVAVHTLVPPPVPGMEQPPPQRQTLLVLGSSGQVVSRAILRPDEQVGRVEWDAAGNPVLPMPEPRSRALRWVALNPRTGAVTPLPKPPALYEALTTAPAAASVAPWRVRSTPMAVREGPTVAKVELLWLESPAVEPSARVLISGDSTRGELLPGSEGVLYQSQGALWVAPLMRLSREQITALRSRLHEKQQRVTATSNAKQVGLILIVYASDHQDTLPGEITPEVAAHLKNPEVFNGFTYTYAGGKLADIEKPAETELGFILGVDGRAVVYADGHVVWKAE